MLSRFLLSRNWGGGFRPFSTPLDFGTLGGKGEEWLRILANSIARDADHFLSPVKRATFPKHKTFEAMKCNYVFGMYQVEHGSLPTASLVTPTT